MRLLWTILFVFGVNQGVNAQELRAVQIYSDNQLLDLIKENKHLSQVVIDECQLVQDIEARAVKAKMPSYQFLWGDMLAYGVCIKKDIPLGLHYMKLAADQGLAEGLEQLGRYYHVGKFMQPDMAKAIVYLREASNLANLKAQLRLAKIYNQGHGSPLDYPSLYSQLHNAVTDDKSTYKQISQALSKLAEKMPEHVVLAAKAGKY
ncbi:sel1 repeat family protein [Endozoicomonas sp. G2_1]|uniref:tetratricopeptide repeat protein n=1 Tax=Endozoicomonas sp. G2_1 TaxID=2821091 RepID=UPI001ADB74D0|nr:tetratricopeptide repeat protein [Endozoicomonas sp. G2_1]MBO9489643.1 sel1 repeat family protein [Endozoicomonas sp. G2_1]